MSEIISLKKFSEVDIKDAFFDSLRNDYDGLLLLGMFLLKVNQYLCSM